MASPGCSITSVRRRLRSCCWRSASHAFGVTDVWRHWCPASRAFGSTAFDVACVRVRIVCIRVVYVRVVCVHSGRMHSESWAFGVPGVKHVLMTAAINYIDLSKPRKTCQRSSFVLRQPPRWSEGGVNMLSSRKSCLGCGCVVCGCASGGRKESSTLNQAVIAEQLLILILLNLRDAFTSND